MSASAEFFAPLTHSSPSSLLPPRICTGAAHAVGVCQAPSPSPPLRVVSSRDGEEGVVTGWLKRRVFYEAASTSNVWACRRESASPPDAVAERPCWCGRGVPKGSDTSAVGSAAAAAHREAPRAAAGKPHGTMWHALVGGGSAHLQAAAVVRSFRLHHRRRGCPPYVGGCMRPPRPAPHSPPRYEPAPLAFPRGQPHPPRQPYACRCMHTRCEPCHGDTSTCRRLGLKHFHGADVESARVAGCPPRTLP